MKKFLKVYILLIIIYMISFYKVYAEEIIIKPEYNDYVWGEKVVINIASKDIEGYFKINVSDSNVLEVDNKNNSEFWLDDKKKEISFNTKKSGNVTVYIIPVDAATSSLNDYLQKNRIDFDIKKSGFVNRNDITYYYANGVMSKGITTIDNEKYFFGELSGILKKDQFVEALFDKNTYCTDKNGKIQTGFIDINKNTYYFNESGIMTKGITTIENEKFFFGENTGQLKKDMFVDALFDKGTYYTDKNGKIQTGFIDLNENTYYFDENGIMAKGIITIENEKYFFGELSGILKKNQFVEALFDKNTYYTDNNGKIKIGFNNINNNTYYFDRNGIMAKGIVTIENEKYFFGELSGILKKNQFVEALFDKNTYYTDKNGKLQYGIINVNNENYFLGELSGILKRDQFVEALFDKNTYYTNKQGKVQYGIVNIDGKKYFLGEKSGILKRDQFVEALFDKNTYYVNKNGELLFGINIIGNQKYFFGELSGILKKNEFVRAIFDGNTYYTNEKGIIQTGILNVMGVDYKFDQNGVLQTGWQEIGGKVYYFDINGNKLTNLQNLEGSKYFFDNNGKLIYKNIKEVIDVSSYQKNIDWNLVKNSGVEQAIIRLGYGTSYVTDECVQDAFFEKNLNGANAYNMLKGIYLYSYAINQVSANKEADFVISKLKKYNVSRSIIIYYDVESNNWTKNLNKNDYDIIMKTFISKVENEGYKVEVYTYKNLAENKFSDYVKSKVGWIAQYNSICTYNGTFNGWQFTDVGKVNGINGNVDISIFK